MRARKKIALVGAGLIGRRHFDVMRKLDDDIIIDSIVDPSEAGQSFAKSRHIPWYPSIGDMILASSPDGAVLATPNQVHVVNGVECVNAGIPILVEKPIATSCSAAEELVKAAADNDVPVLVGHHRRHNPWICRAKEMIKSGGLGRVTSVHGSFWLYKPEDYFEQEWRRKDGGGPIMVNLIHDIDLLRYLCGEIEMVQAISSNKERGFETEDTAVAMIAFKSGALCSFNLSDTIVAPWSWELTASENPEYPATSQSCYMIGGTRASLSIPDMKVWSHGEHGHWKEPIHAQSVSEPKRDPLLLQMKHFIDVIRKEAEPIVSAQDAVESLRAVESIKLSALQNRPVYLHEKQT